MSVPNQMIAGRELVNVPRFGPETMELYKMLLGGSQTGARKGLEQLTSLASGDPSQFEALEKPAIRQYQEFLGEAGSRFSGQGLGGLGSSAFQKVTSGAGASLAENLQSQRLQLQQQAIKDLLGMSSDLLRQTPSENVLVEPEPEGKAWWQYALGIGLPIAGTAIGGLTGGPGGAALGGKLGSIAGKAFLD